MYRSTALLLTTTFLLGGAAAQQQPDGAIVPFTSVLPPCASLCGPLFDVQGACTSTSTAQACFCGDPRLQPFLQGTAGVAQVCKQFSCQDPTTLGEIQSWYESYCGDNKAASPTSGGASAQPTSTGKINSGSANNTWLGTHYKWVIMLVIIVIAITGIWLGSCFFRRRYLRRREKEYEMRPPIAWGPHQMQGATGGYNYGDGVMDASRGGKTKAGFYAPEPKATPANATRGKRESKGWLKKSRT